uniref:Ovule protein n=1 Tax=Mesocestoides corti TaxID=53468 RepID=A0A5K3FZX8_MESCO
RTPVLFSNCKKSAYPSSPCLLATRLLKLLLFFLTIFQDGDFFIISPINVFYM